MYSVTTNMPKDEALEKKALGGTGSSFSIRSSA
jgi:hypothetical protein